jgi:hypothetical protein
MTKLATFSSILTSFSHDSSVKTSKMVIMKDLFEVKSGGYRHSFSKSKINISFNKLIKD